MHSLDGKKIVVASHNAGKLREIAELVSPFGVAVVSARELGLPEPEETGATFIANAELKARAAARASGLPALADDSGLAVDALNGQPGIYSARWAGVSRDFGTAMARVNRELVYLGGEMIGLCGFLIAYTVVQIPLFLIFVGFTYFILRRQRRILKEMLAIDIAQGLIPEEHARIARSAFRSTGWIAGGSWRSWG